MREGGREGGGGGRGEGVVEDRGGGAGVHVPDVAVSGGEDVGDCVR